MENRPYTEQELFAVAAAFEAIVPFNLAIGELQTKLTEIEAEIEAEMENRWEEVERAPHGRERSRLQYFYEIDYDYISEPKKKLTRELEKAIKRRDQAGDEAFYRAMRSWVFRSPTAATEGERKRRDRKTRKTRKSRR
jgi:hypothetical protein